LELPSQGPLSLAAKSVSLAFSSALRWLALPSALRSPVLVALRLAVPLALRLLALPSALQ
jgi:hypothetical protein